MIENKNATDFLRELPRIKSITDDILINKSKKHLCLPDNVTIQYMNDDYVKVKGLSEKLDNKKNQDLLTHIKIEDALNVKYKKTNVYVPKVYAESLDPIIQHMTVQAIVISKVDNSINELIEMIENNCYGKTEYDNIWIGNKAKYEKLEINDLLYIMNRRVGGWDGSLERPVIELLGAGGHLPTIWIEEKNIFQEMDIGECLVKEFEEEIKYKLSESNINKIGGFHNKLTNELVVLCIVVIPCKEIIEIYKNSLNNINENIDGIYLGLFDDVMDFYDRNSDYFAGGYDAKPFNFPNQKDLMRRIHEFLEKLKAI